MKLDLVGKINTNVKLPTDQGLLTLFEAVVNSFQSLEEANPATPYIRITLQRDERDQAKGIKPLENITIVDNGIGFTDENYESFLTSDTQLKVSKGCKGLGRFIWLKAFKNVKIHSVFKNGSAFMERTFEFQKRNDTPEVAAIPSDARAVSTSITLEAMYEEYKESGRHGTDSIARKIIEHCLPYFIRTNCPSVMLYDEGDDTGPLDLNDYFKTRYGQVSVNREFTINDAVFNVRTFKIENLTGYENEAYYLADDRVVEGHKDKLAKLIPDLPKRVTGQNGQNSVYLAFVSGTFLNEKVNNTRTAFEIKEGQQVTEDWDGYVQEITFEHIRHKLVRIVRDDLQEEIAEVSENKRESVESFILNKAPEYHSLLSHLGEFLPNLPPNLSESELDIRLHREKARLTGQMKEAANRVKESAAINNSADYAERLKDFVQKYNGIGKSALAEYVAHRKVVLDILEATLSRNSEGKYSLEEEVHNIIFPMRTDSKQLPYEEQNLWLLDDKLTFHKLLTSDKQLSAIPELETGSTERPDIMMFFDQVLTFSENPIPNESVVLVEFKKPGRKDVEDPVDQVYRNLKNIRTGRIKNLNGQHITFNGANLPAYAYIVCDITDKFHDKLVGILKFQRTPDGQGYFSFDGNSNVYVEVIPYSKLVADAIKRNRALFEKLCIA